MKSRVVAAVLAVLVAVPMVAAAAGNETIESFNRSKKLLERQVYHDHRVTVYCGATFDGDKNICLPDGFTTEKNEKRARRIETLQGNENAHTKRLCIDAGLW